MKKPVWMTCLIEAGRIGAEVKKIEEKIKRLDPIRNKKEIKRLEAAKKKVRDKLLVVNEKILKEMRNGKL